MNDDSITSAAAVRLSNVGLSFADGAVQVFHHLSASIARGQTTALTGASGAGKTSLLAIIAGLLRPSEGQVETLGRSVATMSEDALAQLRRAHIGIVFQHFHLIDTMTALENVALPMQLANAAAPTERAAQSLEAVGLASRLTHFPAELSGGERQRVAIARAFVAAPELLLADEPTGNLDYDTGQAVLETLLELAQQRRTTMIFVTHNQEILRHFDSVICLRDGGLHNVGS